MQRIKRRLSHLSSHPPSSLSPTSSRVSNRSRPSSPPSSNKLSKQHSNLESIPQREEVDFSATNSRRPSPEPSNRAERSRRQRLSLQLSGKFGRHTPSHLRARSFTAPSAFGPPPVASSISAPVSLRSTPSPHPLPVKHDLYTRLLRRISSNSDERPPYLLRSYSASPYDSSHPAHSVLYRSQTSSPDSLSHRTSNNRISRRNSSLSQIFRLGRPANPTPPSVFSTWNNSLSSTFLGPVPHDEELRRVYSRQKASATKRKLRKIRRAAQKRRREALSRKLRISLGRSTEDQAVPNRIIQRSTSDSADSDNMTARRTTKTTTTKPSLASRVLGTRKSPRTHRAPAATTTTTTTTTKITRTTHGAGTAVHHHKRKPTIGDKVKGALTKLNGTLTGRSGKKAAGTRRMHGTDGRGARKY